MEKLSEELTKLNKEDRILPTFSGKMEHLKDESLMLFSYSTYNGKKYRLFYGIGIVYRVVKGDKQDLVYINFGLFKGHKPRLVVVFENHARRQVSTLKKGQVCQVYGMCRNYMTHFELKNKETKGIRLGLYARALLGWYVPTMLDIRKMPVNEDLVEPSEKEKALQENFEDVLNEFMTGKGEEE